MHQNHFFSQMENVSTFVIFVYAWVKTISALMVRILATAIAYEQTVEPFCTN